MYVYICAATLTNSSSRTSKYPHRTQHRIYRTASTIHFSTSDDRNQRETQSHVILIGLKQHF